MHIVDLPLGDLLDDCQLSECQVMFKLSVEDFDFLETDVHIVGVIHHYIFILLCVHFQQGVSEDFVGSLDMPEGSF